MPPPPDVEPMGWDFPTLADGWNLYGLPTLLALVVIAVICWRLRARRTLPEVEAHGQDTDAALLISRGAIRLIALTHLGQAIRAGVGLARELLTLQSQGIPQSFPVTGIVVPVIAIIANLAIGHGLFHLRPWGRRAAITWNALVAIITAIVAAWQWRYHATVRLDQWPDYLVSDGLPWFRLVVMLLPQTRSVFMAGRDRITEARRNAAGCGHGRLSLVWLLALLFLIVVLSTLLVDAAGWLASAMDEGEG
jgi:hypothetical protein